MKLGVLTTAGVLLCAFVFTSAQAEAKKRTKKKRRARVFSGQGVDTATLRVDPVPLPSGEIWIYSVNLREEVRVNIFKGRDRGAEGSRGQGNAKLVAERAAARATDAVTTASARRRAEVARGRTDDRPSEGDGDEGGGAAASGSERAKLPGETEAMPEFDEKALAELDHVFRCKRTGETRAVDPRLYVTLSVIYDHFGGKRIDLVSGFRYQRQEGSRHFHAAAMDIVVPGVSMRDLRDYAESLDTGGMGIGIYPRAGFVHVDWRAPGEPSYRWVDKSGPGGKSRGKRPSRRWKKRRPNS